MGRSFPGDKGGKVFLAEGTFSLHIQGMARGWSMEWLLGKGKQWPDCEEPCVSSLGICFLSCRWWGFNRGLICVVFRKIALEAVEDGLVWL